MQVFAPQLHQPHWNAPSPTGLVSPVVDSAAPEPHKPTHVETRQESPYRSRRNHFLMKGLQGSNEVGILQKPSNKDIPVKFKP